MKHNNILLHAFFATLLLPVTAFGQSADSLVLEQIQEVSNEWATATMQKDSGILEHILADEFYIVGWNGKMDSRDEQMSWVRNQSHTYTKVTNTVLDVRQYGDVVIAIGEYRAEGSEADGTPRRRAGSWQTIYTQRDGRWVAVATHTAQLHDE